MQHNETAALLPRTKLGPFTLKDLKTSEGNEGVAWSALLVRDGVPVATIIDDGWGGAINIRPLTQTGWQEARESIAQQLEAEAAKLPPIPAEGDLPAIPRGWEVAIAEVADGIENMRRLRRKVKTHLLFVRPSEPERILTVPLNGRPWESVKGWLFKHEPGAVVLNDAVKEGWT